MSRREVEGYSLFRAINAVADKNWNKAPLELEAHKAIADKLNRIPDPNRFFVPMEIQERQVSFQDPHAREYAMQRMAMHMPGLSQRDLLVATGSAGGFLVQTDNVGFIEMLRNVSVAFRMGSRRLSGLQGNVMVPRQTGAATAVWLANEASTITESQQVFSQLALSPKNVGAYTEISRQLTLQSSPDAESIVTADLAAVVALAVDLAVIAGSGAAGQPTGIITTAGIGGVTGTAIAFAGILEFQTDVAGANVAPVRGGYVTTPAVAALLIQRVKYASTASPLWEGSVWEGNVQGFPALSSLQIPTANILFGDWDKVIVAEWGVLEIEVNPYANFQAAILGVRAIYTVDVGLRIPAAFSLATTVT
jgi:HK97 family phage major capsid protein